MNQFDVIIIGAGAAGLMCAATAAQKGRHVLLLDHAEKVGKKILISGGGRCNFTNLSITPQNYLSNNPHFCKSALSRFTQYDFIELVEKHNIAYHQKTLGQLFCNHSSQDIVTLLLKECTKGNVTIKTNCTINSIQKNQTFQLKTNQGPYTAQSLVIATGGLSIPKMGATDFGYQIATQFNLNIIPCQPGLVPFTLSKTHLKTLQNLAGISVKTKTSCNKQTFTESILFTHKGLSGPAILQISNYWQAGDTLLINLLPNINLITHIKKWQQEKPNTHLTTLLTTLLPKRLVQTFLQHIPKTPIPNKPIKQYTPTQLNTIAATFHTWSITPTGTEGYRKAEVTRGGIDTNELSSKTFESKKIKNLYFIGEVIDVTGWLGGYNFQWAWSSGYCAGQYV